MEKYIRNVFTMNVIETGVHKSSSKCLFIVASINQGVKITKCVPCHTEVTEI